MQYLSVTITDEKRANLAKLATYLENLPVGYDRFDMADFAHQGPEYKWDADKREYVWDGLTFREHESRYALENGGVGRCGAVACAVGHGPAAGILFNSNRDFYSSGVANWSSYTSNNFIDAGSEAFEWCFSGAWCETDNTPTGAAARIRILLNHGLPDDAVEQMYGDAPLCYAEVA